MTRRSALTVEDARQVLRSAGLRCTTSRLAVTQFLASADRPVTHAEAAESLVPKGYDKSTIYRSLVELSENGIASRLELGDHAWRFEYRPEGKGDASDEHPHFMCLDCGQVSCLPETQVQVSNRRGASPGVVTEILLKGHCNDCR